jgi:hypothetical protein
MAKESQQAEIQKAVDQAEEQGFIGTKVDPRDNEEYSLQSGPDSPSAAEQNITALRARADAAEADLKDKQ